MPRSSNSALAIPEELSTDDFRARLTELALAAQQDDGKAKALHAFCRAHPEAWDHFGTLEADAIDGWLNRLVPTSSGQPHLATWKREHIEDQLGKRRTALRADGDSPLEYLLINRILGAWLQLMDADATYARVLQRGGTFKEVKHYQRAVDAASKQLIRAVEALARVRRLLGSSHRATPDRPGRSEPTAGHE